MTRFNQFNKREAWAARGPHGHGHGEGRGHGPWGAEEFGPPFRRRGRMRRGDIKLALLRALADGPAHGYEVIRRLEERSGGLWRPSAGSVYPTLQLLEEQELLRSHEEGGKRVYELTDAGRAQVESAQNERFPWEGEEELSGHRALMAAVAQLALAAKQVQVAGHPELVEQAAALIRETRQKLYQLLAES